jgi:hypothetical protein
MSNLLVLPLRVLRVVNMTGCGRKVGYIRKVLNEALPDGSLTWYKNVLKEFI